MIEQALCHRDHAGGHQFLARSPAFRDDWLSEAERLCKAFGQRPNDGACPQCVFAQPFGRRHVAIVQVFEQMTDRSGQPGILAFSLLVVPRADYHDWGGDPFVVADRFPPDWQARGELPALTWSPEASTLRTVEQVQRVLQRSNGPNLLGGSQVLVDGGRLVFERPVADTDLLRDLWTLLPTSTRREIWPASFAFGNALRFDVLVMPKAGEDEFARYVTEEQAADYPQGHYELSLQIAAEAGDQAALNALFGRRSRKETMRLGVMILVGLMIVSLLVPLLTLSSLPAPKEPATAPSGPATAPGEKNQAK